MSKIDQWANDCAKELNIFREETEEKVFAVIKDVANQGIEMLKTVGDYEDRTGEYRKSFRCKVDRTYRGTTARIYSTQPQLTHLLENGHVILNSTEEKYGRKWGHANTKSGLTRYKARRGGTERTRAFPHWKPTEDFIAEEIEEQIRKALSE